MHKYISEIKANDHIKDYYLVYNISEIEETKSKKFFLVLKLKDKSGEIKLNIWSNTKNNLEELLKKIKKGDVILIEANAKEYNNKIELNSNNTNIKVLKRNEYELSVFIESKIDEDKWEEFYSILQSVQNKDLKKIIDYFFNNKAFVKEFKESPASIKRHYNYIGGLLEHCLSIMKICLELSNRYPLDTDLLISGAALHDIGKTEAYEISNEIKLSKKAKLIGIEGISLELLENAFNYLNTGEDLKIKLKHIVLSRGLKEYSIIEPATLEAYAIAKAKEMDAMLNIISKDYEKEKIKFIRDFEREFFF